MESPSPLLHYNCLTTEKVRQALITNGAIPALVGCQTFKDSTVQAGAVQALGMLATDQVARQQVYTMPLAVLVF